jgi:Spy/CpxP family protein refolding chaperone
MKKKLVLATLAICVMAAGSLTANAYQGGRGGCYQSGQAEVECDGNEWCGNQSWKNRQGRVAAELDLSDEQQDRIETIREEERDTIRALRDKMHDYQEQLRELTDEGTFDEGAIRKIAEEKARIQVEMSVAKAKMHSQIKEVMTPEQQELAAKFRTDRFDKRGYRRGGRGRW